MDGIVEIKKVVYGGLGLAHDQGDTLFIPYTAPGDRIRCRTVSRKKKCVFAEIAEIVEPSPLRRGAECPVFADCGGCHFLHVSYEDELALKKEFVLETLQKIGKIRTEIEKVVPSPFRFGYRNHTIFQIDGVGRPGFYRRESSEVVPFPEAGCLLLPEKMREAIGAVPPESLKPGSEARARMDRYENVQFWGLSDMISPPDLLMEAGGFNFPVQPSAFFQVNRFLNDTLMELVLEMPMKVRRRLLDLYCGCGFFTFPLAAMAVDAIGIELDPEAHRSANSAKRLNRVDNVSFRKGSVESELRKIREADLIVADPPRSGIPAAAMSGILKLRPGEIIMVSCEPPSFARDAAKLIEAGYILSRIVLVDMFPGTYHVETVGLFRRA